ncbi:MarR family winged helix-turn-helix transcriptional regulator [Chryseobacterium sp. W4I1]|uniref:MarR family winged helix-turn-helix transcriptional regulator n=1 Tax=Chryseobacterium sp. W4I1 TaxID=3042293 RepID=UPI002781B8C9|nr:MarR family winged helix-turn-helix transcriptional regulator [Chryseobacterium sp. W4I1]MDQ0782032.1 DNA-binding MarR family transcriptional regulator [Chryseobacterium sp. W4I1]
MKTKDQFFNIFTDLQCFILANMNKGNISGVTATHYNIIEYIYRKQEVTGKQIATAFNVSQAAVSKQIRFLMSSDLIEQKQNGTDRRIFNLSATEKGEYLINNSEDFRKKVADQAADILTKEELRTLTNLLDKVMDNIKM